MVRSTGIAAAILKKLKSVSGKYELQEAARGALGRDHRVGGCLRKLAPTSGAVGVNYSPGRQRAHYTGLMTCGLVWPCPVCASKIAESRRAELEAAVTTWLAQGGWVALVTFTFSHGPSEPLQASLSRFLTAQRQMTRDRPYRALAGRYGLAHSVKALEVTWGAENGWHPHAHWIVFGYAEEPGRETLETALYGCWAAAARRAGLSCSRERGVDARPGDAAVGRYLAKDGGPGRRPWSLADELVQANFKRGRSWGEGDERGRTPFDLLRWYLDSDDEQPAALFREYERAFKGRHQLQWSRGLRAALALAAERPDGELAAVIDADSYLLALLSRDEWRAVRWYQQRGELLALAFAGEVEPVVAFVGELARRYRVEVGALHQAI